GAHRDAGATREGGAADRRGVGLLDGERHWGAALLGGNGTGAVRDRGLLAQPDPAFYRMARLADEPDQREGRGQGVSWLFWGPDGEPDGDSILGERGRHPDGARVHDFRRADCGLHPGVDRAPGAAATVQAW